ncbi:MAG: DUF4382 domain-containing protein [Candidatus Acidiferrales bacterium]
MREDKVLKAILAILFAATLASCGGSSSSTTPPATKSGSVFTIGTDAPASVPSIVSFTVTVTSITVSDGTTTANLLTAPQQVDFARFNGLRTLLDLTSVPTGTYTSATITLSPAANVGFIDTSVSPPVISNVAPTITNTSVTENLATPFVVGPDDATGFFMDFDLRQSITISNGQVMVNPVFDVKGLAADDPDREIDEFYAGVISVSQANNSFVIQGPHGRQFTVQTAANTDFEDGGSLANLDTNTIVEVEGTIDPLTMSIDASEVELVSKDHFFVGGLITNTSPAAPSATTALDEYIRAELPDLTLAPLGTISTFALSGSEIYSIANVRLPITALLFNQNSLAPGQHVAIAGSLNTQVNPPTLTVHRVVLERQGQSGTWVPGSTQIAGGNNGRFQLNDLDLAGVLLPNPVTVITTNATDFDGLSGLSALSGTNPIPIRVIGFVLFDSGTGKAVMVARRVQALP